MPLQAVLFILGFAVVLGIFIYFIVLVSRRFSGRISLQAFTAIERVLIGGIVAGVAGMFQPWIFVGYKYGFLLLLFSTLAFIVWSHVTPVAPLYGQEDFVDVPAGQGVREKSLAETSTVPEAGEEHRTRRRADQT